MAQKGPRSFVITNLKCEKCGTVFQIPRIKGQIRSKGHIKHVWCFKCKEITAHRDYLKEYDVIGRYVIDHEDRKCSYKKSS